MQPITIKGAAENNLKGFDISIPKNKLIVFTGVSGSGKSSLVFGTIAKESQRQLNDTFPLYIRHKLPLYERPKAASMENLTPSIVVNQKPVAGGSRSSVATLVDIAPLFRLLFSRCGTPSAGVATAYSSNTPRGMCPTCKGIGETVTLDLDALLDKNKSLNDGAICFKPWGRNTWQWRLYGHSGFFDNDKPLKDYTPEEWFNLLHGSGRKVIIENDPSGVWYEGIVDRFNRLYLNKDVSKTSLSVRSAVQKVVSIAPCPECHGKKLNSAALNSRIAGRNIADVFDLEIIDVIGFLDAVDSPIGRSLKAEIAPVLDKIVDLGLGYLTLNRRTDTLSGGEAQRLKLVKYLTSSLTGMTYILDEPSTGMHPHDIDKIIKILKLLRDKGNSVLVVEHEPLIIQAADEIVDIGPSSGIGGGQLIYQGSLAQLPSCKHSVTAQWLQKPLTLSEKVFVTEKYLTVRNATLNNLDHITVNIPVGALTTVTGVSGSGKSSLILGELAQQYPDATILDQKPVGISNRSNLATYLGIMDSIREEFANKTGVKASMFSFNSLGQCPNCQGKGVIEADMVFADPVIVICEECRGKRYSNEALAYTYQSKNISDILAMTGDEAVAFFDSAAIAQKLFILQKVGLGYMTLGQSTSTLSGGELQRMKLASSLEAQNKLYLLDEPSSGLHMADIDNLLHLLRKIVDEGNTVVVIEHDLQLIAQSDWIIDIGPGGGRFGGKLLYEGPPNGLINNGASLTAQWLRKSVA